MKKKNTLLIVGSLIIVLVLGVIVGYNSLVKAETAVESQWANVDSKLQRRADLIPNLVNSVKGSMSQEEKVFTRISDARVAMSQAKTVAEVSEANQKLESSVGNLMITMEAYPDLKSSENVKTLMTQLEGSENRISVERDRYNQEVKQYNVSLKTFPKSVLAKSFGFEKKDFFQAEGNAKEVPEVDLSSK